MSTEMTLAEYRAMLASQKQRAPQDNREHREQVALFEWAAMNEARMPELAMLFAIPNGGQRHPAVAAKLRAEGQRAGVPDICLAAARGEYHALWIELKAPGGTVKAHQQAWIDALNAQQHRAIVCYGWYVAASTIVEYLGYCREDVGL